MIDAEAVSAAIASAVDEIGDRSFSTAELMDVLRKHDSPAWREIVAVYGEGGRGSGYPYSAASFISAQLGKLSRSGGLVILDYRPAPPHWGNRIIRYWARDRQAIGGTLFPNEVEATADEQDGHVEGATTTVTVNRYERDPKAREACIEHFGVSCVACGVNFEDAYGPHGAGFIHVHHLRPLSEIKQAHPIDPKKDLVPVCPNCHAMIHYGSETLTIASIKQLLEGARAKLTP